MKHRLFCKKLKSRRGSGIAEALVGFLICVLSAMILLSIVTSTTELIKKGDISLTQLYAEEAAMEEFGASDLAAFSSADGTLHQEYTNAAGTTSHYTVSVQGEDPHSSNMISIVSPAAYFETQHHHLLGFKPN